MFVYHFEFKHQLPLSLEEAWSFFSSPKNLKEITPDHLGFKITHLDEDREMYEGQLICYIVKPILGVPLRWTTEITHIKKGAYFIDEQRAGPYKMWHHEHWFEENEKGVLMTDRLSYALPLGWLGRLANFLFVDRQVKGIFTYREEKLNQLFAKK